MAPLRERVATEAVNAVEARSPAKHWRAILMMDIVGYASLIERDQARTIKRVETLWRTCLQPAIERHRGRVLQKRGDGAFVEFRTAHEAVACAIDIQKGVAAKATEEPLIRYRGGIDAGEIMVRKDDVHGHAVNIAARLQDKAAVGGIIVSQTIKELVHGQVAEPMDDVGDLQLKGIERRVRAFSLLELPDWWRTGGRPSIAVLPFEEIDSQTDYFGDGMVENIVNALATRRDLFVVSRSSTLSFRRDKSDLRQVQEQLGVRYVLSGSVQRARDDIRIFVELSDSESQQVLWSDRIRRRLKDIFELQDQVSQRIVGLIAPSVQEAEISRIASKRPENFSAYDCFLRGLDLVYRLNREQFDGALGMFTRAIKLDPGYAAPYAFSALWYAVHIGQGWSEDLEGDRERIRNLADRAWELDKTDATSLALCGHVLSLQCKDFATAFDRFDNAIRASPSSAIAWTRSSPTYSYVGDWKEGRRRAEKGLQLSPLDRHRFFTHTALALAAYTGEEYEEAIAWGQKAMSENPNFTAIMRLLCAALSAKGLIAEAKVVAAKLLERDRHFSVERFCANYAYKEPERRERLAAHLEAAGLPK